MNRSMNALTPKEKINLAQWAYIIRDCRASRQTVKAWCQEYQIPIRKYYYWLNKLRNAQGSNQRAPVGARWLYPAVQKAGERADLNGREIPGRPKRFAETIAYLTHQKYGRTSEKTAALQSAYREQLSFLFNEAEVTEAEAKAEEEKTVTVAAHKRKKRRAPKKRISPNVEYQKVLIPWKEDHCEVCGHDLVPMGERFVRSEVQYIPARVTALDYYQKVKQCRSCRGKGQKRLY